MQDYYTITESKQAAEILREHMAYLDHEELWGLFLAKGLKVISFEMISSGTAHETVVDNRAIIKKALEKDVHLLIIAHNHPSGNPLPSVADIKVTNSLRRACRPVDIVLLDHIIVSRDSFYSFLDEIEAKFTDK